MQKITINDFSGGIQESTIPDDFTSRQWAQLKGIIPSSELNFESQWAIQTVGSSFGSFTAVYPLASSSGTFLVAIKSDGTLWWCAVPAADAAYTTANAVTWRSIGVDAAGSGTAMTAENYLYTGAAKTTINANTDYKFICSVPLQVYKYATTPDSGDLDNPSKDTSGSSSLQIATAVMLNSTTVNGSADSANWQAVVAYVDTTASCVRAITFPNLRRVPMHDSDAGDFIKARVDATTIVDFPAWLTGTSPYRAAHPYTYLDKNATLLPGRGVVPRANVGTTKSGLLMLGDIEWRSDKSTEATYKSDAYLQDTGNNNTFGTTTKQVVWPANIPTYSRVIYNEGSGIAYVKDDGGIATSVTNKVASAGTATITTAASHGYTTGDLVDISNVDAALNGTFTITGTPAGTTFTFASAATVASTPVTNGKAFAYNYRVEVGEYQTIPNSWSTVYIASTVDGSKLKAVSNLNAAYHLLNDSNTGPHRGAMYFTTGGDIDEFDPRGVLVPGKTDVSIAGMHMIDDTAIIITTAGSQLDGVFRLRGYLSRLIQYGGTNDSSAVRIELVRGGIGAVRRSTTTHKNFSTVWSEAGVVAFIDRLGGLWYTNGQDCDRLDRYGPKQPKAATENDHVAELGKHLFMWRDGRLLCFTLMASNGEDKSGTGCWTEVVTPGTISSMVGARNELFFIYGGNVMRMGPSGPDAERGRINNTPITITVSTLTAGEVSDHKRTNWHKFGMTFTTPTSCTVGTVRVQSTGALNISGSAVFPDVQYLSTLNRTYSDVGIIGEFLVNAGIGPQASCSATVTFTGYVQLQSASFWVSGQTPRVGDK
jgi:hypothetical protein